MNNSVVNSIASEVTGSLVECSFNALAIAAGFPEALFISPLAKGLVLGLVKNCFNDCSEMTLSINEKKSPAGKDMVMIQMRICFFKI